MKTRCPIELVTLELEACPVRCIYRGKDKRCNYVEYKQLSAVSSEDISRITGEDPETIEQKVERGKKAIKIILIADGYASYLGSYSRNVRRLKNVNSVQELFGLTKAKEKEFWDREKFEAWAEMKGISVNYEDFLSVLGRFKS